MTRSKTLQGISINAKHKFDNSRKKFSKIRTDLLISNKLTLLMIFIFLAWGSSILSYSTIVRSQKEQLLTYHDHLDSQDITNQSLSFKVDYLLILSEMDDQNFYLNIPRQISGSPSLHKYQAITNLRQLQVERQFKQTHELRTNDEKRMVSASRAFEKTEKILFQGRKNLAEIVLKLAKVALKHQGCGYYTSKASSNTSLKTIENNRRLPESIFLRKNPRKSHPQTTRRCGICLNSATVANKPELLWRENVS